LKPSIIQEIILFKKYIFQEIKNMKNNKIITVLVLLIIIFSGIATVMGITSNHGSGEYDYRSIRG